jgi:hypothetical protein
MTNEIAELETQQVELLPVRDDLLVLGLGVTLGLMLGI